MRDQSRESATFEAVDQVPVADPAAADGEGAGFEHVAGLGGAYMASQAPFPRALYPFGGWGDVSTARTCSEALHRTRYWPYNANPRANL